MNDEITLGYLIDPFEQFQDTNGLPIISGIVEVYDEDTENLATIYKDFNQTLQTNPCPTDSLGNVTVIADGTKFYNIIVKDSEGNILLSKNHIKVSNSITETEIINQRAVVLPGNGINVVTTELGNTTNYTVSIDPDYSITNISGADGIEVSADGSNYTVYPTSSLFDKVNAEYGLYKSVEDLGDNNYRINIGLNHFGDCRMDGTGIAVGKDTTATNVSFAQGDSCVSNSQGSHAEGYYTTANNRGSHSEGYTTITNGEYSHAEGVNTIANGPGSHSEGNGTTALGNWSHAEGDHSIATGWHSHAGGSNTSAYGSCSHTIGSNTIAYGTNSLAGGFYTIASGTDQTVFGKYNIPNGTDLFQIGAGTPGNNNKNALTVDNNGDVNVNTTTGLKNTRVFFDNVGETTYNYTRFVPIHPCSGNDFIPLTNGGDTGVYGVCSQSFNVPLGKKVKVDGFYQIKGGIDANGGVSNWAGDPICETWIIDDSTGSATEINQAVITNGGNLPRSVPIPFSFVTGGDFKLGFCSEGTWGNANFTNRLGQTNPTAGNVFISYTTTIIDKE